MWSLPDSAKSSESWARYRKINDIAELNSQVIIENGSSNFWIANWTGAGPLIKYIDEVQVQVPFPLLSVSEFEAQKGELLPQLSGYFSSDIMLELDKARSFTEMHDYMIWKPNIHGVFTIHSAYQVLRPKSTEMELFQKFWNNLIPNKISFFMWKLLQNALPFADILMSTGLNLPSKCTACESIDSLNHYFNSCHLSVFLWTKLHELLNITYRTFRNIRERVTFYWSFNSSVHSSITVVLSCLICWELWKARNSFLYQNVTTFAPQLWKNIVSECSLIYTVHPAEICHTNCAFTNSGLMPLCQLRKIKKLYLITWEPPDSGLKVNCDASIQGNSIGLGCILRDKNGNLIHAFSCYKDMDNSGSLPYISVLRAELMAIEMGLQAAGGRTSHVHIQSDCSQAINILNGQPCPWALRHLLAGIRHISSIFQSVHFTHIYREGNQSPDFIAKLAIRLGRSSTFEELLLSHRFLFLNRRETLFPQFKWKDILIH